MGGGSSLDISGMSPPMQLATYLYRPLPFEAHNVTALAASLENVFLLLLSAGAVFVIQGGLVLLAGVLAPFMTAAAINEMTCAGSILIIMIGTNLMGITKIKVADFLPAILFAPTIYNVIPWAEKLWGMLVS